MDGAWTLEPSEEVCAPAQVELTWTPERIERLTALWEEGVTTAEIGRRIGGGGQGEGVAAASAVLKDTLTHRSRSRPVPPLPQCGRGLVIQRVSSRMARSMPSSVRGNMRSSISARIMPMLVVPPQYFSG